MMSCGSLKTSKPCWFLLAVLVGVLSTAVGLDTRAQSFAELIGDVQVGDVKKTSAIQVPYITWGGDVATFYANGGLKTQKGSLYQELGLNLQLKPGDDFVEQVRAYMRGDSPLLRGTLRMIGQASGVIGSNPKTKPVVFLQLTWSAGDHVVSRGDVKTLDDLKGKKIILQQGGPHVGMLDDALRAAQLSWDDIEVVWAEQLTGPGGPAEMFVNDQSIDACCVISPDMIGLTGGLDAVGTGAEGTVKNAKVLVSTAQMSRSIADVYVCRKDWYDANREWVDKFVAGYFKASEDVATMRNRFEETGNEGEYFKTLKMAQDILGADVLPTLEIDAHGLLLDCTFVGLPGNKAFFEDRSNLAGFEVKQRQALDLATGRGYAKVRAGFFAPGLNYDRIATLGKLTKTQASGADRIAESIDAFPGDESLDENTILAFTISFEPNQNEFTADIYGPEFLRAIENASTFGNAVVAIRGHSDPTKTLVDMVKAGLSKGVITRSGSSGNYRYFFNGKALDLTDTPQLVKLVQSGAFDGDAQANPRETMQAALNLSRARAVAVRDAVIQYAKAQGYKLDASQIQPVGVGVGEPLIAKPSNMNEARENMRVEFRLVKVPAEVVTPSDFDF